MNRYDVMERIHDEEFNMEEWDISREGRMWTNEEFDRRLDQTPEKIEFVGGVFTSEEERLVVLAMLLENLGIDKVVRLGKLADWKEAIQDLERKRS